MVLRRLLNLFFFKFACQTLTKQHNYCEQVALWVRILWKVHGVVLEYVTCYQYNILFQTSFSLQKASNLISPQLWRCLRLLPPASLRADFPTTTATSSLNSTRFSKPHHQPPFSSYIGTPHSNHPTYLTLAHPTILSQTSSDTKLQSLPHSPNHHIHPNRVVHSARAPFIRTTLLNAYISQQPQV